MNQKNSSNTATRIPRFSAVKYDDASQSIATALKAKFEELEHAIETHVESDREQSLALTHLEIAHAFVGKAIRNSQIRRLGQTPV